MRIVHLFLPPAVILACALSTDPSVAETEDPQTTGLQQREAQERYAKSFEFGATFVRDAESTAFAPINFDDLPLREVVGSMYSSLAFVLVWEAHPQRQGFAKEPGRMAVAAYAARNDEENDLVEYRWVYLGQTIRAVRSLSALQIDLDLDEINNNVELAQFGKLEVQRVRGFVEHIIRMEGESHEFKPQRFRIDIPWPASLTDELEFSTNPDRNLLHMDVYRWYERIDFWVHGRTFSIRFYRKPGQLMGLPDGSKWFPDDFRALVQSKMQAQRKLAPPVPKSRE